MYASLVFGTKIISVSVSSHFRDQVFLSPGLVPLMRPEIAGPAELWYVEVRPHNSQVSVAI